MPPLSEAMAGQGATLEIENSTTGAVTITGITLGAETKITGTHDLSVGDVVTFASIGGTTELNGVSAMVTGVESTTDFWVHIDSQAYGAWTAGGTATPATYTAVGEVVSLGGPDGSAAEIPTSHLQSTHQEFLIGLPDVGNFSAELNMVFGDAGQQACLAAWEAGTLKGWRLSYVDGTVRTWDGYVKSFNGSLGVDEKVAGSIVIRCTGPAPVVPA